MDIINQFSKEFEEIDHYLVFYLVNKVQEYIAEIITQWGLCSTYNIAFNHDVLHTNLTSNDFHYEYGYRMTLSRPRIRDPIPQNYPMKISTSHAGLWVGFSNYRDYTMKFIDNKFHGFVVIFHNPYELPTRFSKVLMFNTKLQTRILLNPQLNLIEETLMDYEPAE